MICKLLKTQINYTLFIYKVVFILEEYWAQLTNKHKNMWSIRSLSINSVTQKFIQKWFYDLY